MREIRGRFFFATNFMDGTKLKNRLPLHDIGIVNAQGAAVAVETYGDGQTHGGFGSSDNHHKEDKDLTVNLIQISGKGNESEIDCIKHELDAEKHGNDVLLHNDADRSDREKQSTQYQIVGNFHDSD
jgi:hypothetical protein